jgi:hypothetical protein
MTMCPEGDLMVHGLQGFVCFSATYYAAVAGLCQKIVGAWSAIWLAWQFVCLATGHPRDTKAVIDDLLVIVVANSVLASGWVVWDLFKAILATGVWAAGKAYAVDGSGPGNVGELACYALNGIDEAILYKLRGVMQGLGYTALGAAIWAIAMFFAVAALMLRILKHLSEPLVDVAMLYVLLPFLVTFIAIAPFRSAAGQGLKLMVTATLEMVLISGIVGVMMAMIVGASLVDPVKGGVVDTTLSSEWLGGANYFLTLALVVFFFFALGRAVQMPGRLFGMFSAKGLNLSLPKF